MTTKQTIARLKPLRSNVSRSRQRVLDTLQTGVRPEQVTPYLDLWREAVKQYLECLRECDADPETLDPMISTLHERLNKGFEMEYPQNTAEGWKMDKHFESLLSELEVCCDLYAGAAATRRWLLATDQRLHQVARRDTRLHRHPEPETAQEVTA